MRLLRIASAIAAVAVFVGCSNREDVSAAASPCPPTGVRVFLGSDGNVSVNEKAVAAADLKKALEAVSLRPTEACYSRENPNSPPPPQMATVLDSVAALKVPISFYTDKTFTKRVILK